MIDGAHVVIYSTDAEADRAFLRDVLEFRHVDVGHGWLIFALPDSEVAVHPGDVNDMHQFFLMCDDIDGQIATLADKGVACDPVTAEPWGRLTKIALPGGGKLGLYQPRHARPQRVTSPAAPKARSHSPRDRAPARTARSTDRSIRAL